MEVVKRIICWGESVELFEKSNIDAQSIKFIEEQGELATAFRKNLKGDVLDSFGDIIVVAIMLLKMQGATDEEIINNFNYGVKHPYLWMDDNLTKDLRYFFADCANFYKDIHAYNGRRAFAPFRNMVAGANTFIEIYTKTEYTLNKVLKNVSDIIHSRVKGIEVDERGFAIKAEDRA